MITRTFKLTRVTLAVINVIDGKIVQENKDPVAVTGDYSTDKLLRISKEKAGIAKEVNAVIIKKEVEENVYGVTEDYFLAGAKVITRPESQQKHDEVKK